MLNTAGHLIGIIPKVVLNEIVKQKLFYDSSALGTIKANKGTGLNHDDQEEELLDANALNKANKQYEASYDEKEGGFPTTPLSKQIKWSDILPNLN